MKIYVIVLVAALIGVSVGQDCSAKFKSFHQCMEDSHKKDEEAGKAKYEAMKSKINACYTDNGCTPPANGQGSSDSGEGGQCRKAFREAMKQNFESCIKQYLPSFTFPSNDAKGKPHRGWNQKDENKALDGCPNKQVVRDCKRALFTTSRPNEEEKRAMFQTRCDARQKCLTNLGADCQVQLDKFEKAACQCRKQQDGDRIRTGIPECQGVERMKGTRPPTKQEMCDRKDYCTLGYCICPGSSSGTASSLDS